MLTVFLVCLLIPTGLEGAPWSPSDPMIGLKTLFHLSRLFLVIDVDDDNYLEYDDVVQTFLRADVNRDGIYSKKDLKNDPDFKEATKVDLKAWELDGDGKVTMKDVYLHFYDRLSAAGNDISLLEYLTEMGSREKSEGEKVKVSAFVTAKKNFEVSDMDDSKCLSEFEYLTEFRFADRNGDDILQIDELDAFRPARFVKPDMLCPEALSSGCTKQVLLDLFHAANTDKSQKLKLEEAVTFFAKRM